MREREFQKENIGKYNYFFSFFNDMKEKAGEAKSNQMLCCKQGISNVVLVIWAEKI